MPGDDLSRRISKLRRLCRERELDAVLLTDPVSVRYFSGFTGEDSALLVGRRWQRLLTDGRFAEQARLDCPEVKAVIRTGPMREAVAAALAGRRVGRLGVEGRHMTLAAHDALKKDLRKVRLEALGGEPAGFREVKSEAELRAIRKAVRVAEAAFAELTGRGAEAFVGRPEREVAAELDSLMRLGGASAPSFETIVAAGPHAALPHYRPGSTRIRRGRPVLIDWGAKVGGYCSDLTRVVFLDRIPPQLAEVYQVVLRAQEAGLRACGPGVSGGEVDAAAREVIEQAGYGEAFTHGLGHGVGLEVHEGPRLGRKVEQELAAGMVVTVEPGVYLPGVGGVRIEDDVQVTSSGRRKLSRLPRDLESMVLG